MFQRTALLPKFPTVAAMVWGQVAPRRLGVDAVDATHRATRTCLRADRVSGSRSDGGKSPMACRRK